MNHHFDEPPSPKRAAASSDECPPLKVKKLAPTATLPRRASPGAAGYDLCASEAATIPAGCRKIVKTDLSIAIPPRHYGRVAPRSGLSFKYGIDIGAGVIDPVSALSAPLCSFAHRSHTSFCTAGLHRTARHRHGQQRHAAL